MSIELIPYEEIEKIRAKLEKEEVRGNYWKQFVELDNPSLIKEAGRTYRTGVLLTRGSNRLDRLADKFNPVTAYFLPSYKKLQKIAIRHDEKNARNVAKMMIIYRLAEDRKIHPDSWM